MERLHCAEDELGACRYSENAVWWLRMSAHRRIKASIPPSRAGSLDLVGGELAWDFTNTSSGRGSLAKLEHLRNFDTLIQWVEHARVMPPSDCAYARAELAGHPRRSQRILERTIEMRLDDRDSACRAEAGLREAP